MSYAAEANVMYVIFLLSAQSTTARDVANADDIVVCYREGYVVDLLLEETHYSAQAKDLTAMNTI